MNTDVKIHPTAIVEDGVELGPGTEVGAWVLIRSGVKLGSGCRVLARATIEGDVVAGDRNVFGYGCVVGTPPQDFAYDESRRSGVRIGHGNTFREYVTIHRATGDDCDTVVGNACYLMVNTHLGHNAQVGDEVIIANDTLLGGHVSIANHAVIGGGAIFHQFMRVGRFAMVRGGGRFSKDIPPFTIGDTDNVVSGVNVVGLRRKEITVETRNEIRRAFRLVFLSGLNISQALERSQATRWGAEAQSFFDFIRESKKRGICGYSGLVKN